MEDFRELQHARILIVDDDKIVAQQIATIIRELGHQPTVTHDWSEALRAFEAESTDLVLMDAVMPSVDGMSLTRLLRAKSRPYVPIVFLTALSSPESREDCINAGADDFLTKPPDRIELRVRLTAMLRIRSLTRALEHKTAALEQAVRTDSLTGVGNRRVFEERIAEEVARARRHRRPLSLLMFDLDHFKSVNDRFGHVAGDDLLAAFGATLRREVRISDIACRYGGEEFAVIAPETRGAEARTLAERIRVMFRERSGPALAQSQAHNPAEGAPAVTSQTVSAGISGTDSLGPSFDTRALKTAADQALYRAKQRGRDRVEVFEPSPAAVADHAS